MLRRLRSPGASRVMVWVSSLVLIAGVIAFATVRLGSGGATTDATPRGVDGTAVRPGSTTTPTKTTNPAKISEVPKAARIAAGQFILAAVGREDLPKAWRLSPPSPKKGWAGTYKKWM